MFVATLAGNLGQTAVDQTDSNRWSRSSDTNRSSRVVVPDQEFRSDHFRSFPLWTLELLADCSAQ